MNIMGEVSYFTTVDVYFAGSDLLFFEFVTLDFAKIVKPFLSLNEGMSHTYEAVFSGTALLLIQKTGIPTVKNITSVDRKDSKVTNGLCKNCDVRFLCPTADQTVQILKATGTIDVTAM